MTGKLLIRWIQSTHNSLAQFLIIYPISESRNFEIFFLQKLEMAL